MKPIFNKITIILLSLTFSIAASAQVYIGGSVGGAYTDSPNTNSRSWAVSINPEAGYSFGNWAVGGRVTYGKSESKIESPYLKETKTELSLLTINPYAAYSFLRLGNIAVCAELGLQFSPEQNGAEYSTFGAYITPLLTYSINEHLILKTSLDFAGLAVSGSSDGNIAFAGVLGGDDAIRFGEDLSIGFVYRF